MKRIAIVFLCIQMTIACKTRRNREIEGESQNLSSSGESRLALADASLIATLNQGNVVAVYYVDTQKNTVDGIALIKNYDLRSSRNSGLELAGGNTNPPGPSSNRESEPRRAVHQIVYQNLLFHLPEGYAPVKTFNPSTGGLVHKVIGEGVKGVCFLIMDEAGKQYVLKYFKQGGGLIDNVAELQDLAKMSVMGATRRSPEDQARIESALKQAQKGKEGAEDLAFIPQQQAEAASLYDVTIEQWNEPSLISDKEKRDQVALAKQGGVGTISAQAVDLEFGELAPSTDPSRAHELVNVRKETFLIKPVIEGYLLRTLLEGSDEGAPKFNGKAAEAITTAITAMSHNGLFYSDLNAANWILKETNMLDPNGERVWTATPFDMKPGKKVEGISFSGAANAEGMLGKISPLGQTSGWAREAYIQFYKATGLGGRSHPAVKTDEARRNIELLDRALKDYIKMVPRF